jgi:hypothetical protein
MEQFLIDVQNYAAAAGRSPVWVLKRAVGASGTKWAEWQAGESSPTMATADRIRAWMAANPPAAKEEAA